jgi:tetratricopeptide (TPR) repeat protein
MPARFCLVLFMAIVAAGCCSSPVPVGPPDEASLNEADRCFLAAKYPEAVGFYARYISSSRPDSAKAVEAMRHSGICSLKTGDTAGAVSILEKAEKAATDRSARARVLTSLGDARRMKGDFAEAETCYGNALESDRYALKQDEVLYHLGLCQQRQGRWEAARITHDRLKREFPSSEYAMEEIAANPASQPSGSAGTCFTVQAGAFSDIENAVTLSGRLRREGFDPTLAAVHAGGKLLHVVRVGQFTTWTAANDEAARLRAAGFTDVKVIP